MKKLLALTGVVVCVVMLGSDSRRVDLDAATGTEALQGRWFLLGVEADGEKVPADKLAGVRSYCFTPGGLTVQYRQAEEAISYTTDWSRTPAHLDLRRGSAHGQDHWLHAVIQIDGDTLKIGWTETPFETRPRSWSDPSMTVLTFRRERL
jgi:uncharacterized protein (TIGR03067 family)